MQDASACSTNVSIFCALLNRQKVQMNVRFITKANPTHTEFYISYNFFKLSTKNELQEIVAIFLFMQTLKLVD